MELIDIDAIRKTGQIPAGLKLIQDQNTFHVLDMKKGVFKHPLLEGTGSPGLPVMRCRGIFQKADERNANGRVYPLKVLKEAVQVSQSAIKERGMFGELDHACMCSDDFRVLTVDGWKEFKDIKIGDYIWSRVDGKLVRSRVNGITNEPYNGPAYRVFGRNINCEFTPGHRFLMLKRPDSSQFYATIEDIYLHRRNYVHSPIPKTAIWDGNNCDTFSLPGVKEITPGMKQSMTRANNHKDLSKDLIFESSKFAGLLGLYLAEGCSRNYGITICQKTESGRALIKDFLNNLHPELIWNEVDSGFYTHDPRLAAYLKPLGNKYNKYIPNEIKQFNSEDLEQLVFWFVVGDGRMLKVKNRCDDQKDRYLTCKSEYGTQAVLEKISLDIGTYSRVSMFTVSKRLINDLHECILKTGRCARLSRIEPTECLKDGRIIKGTTTLYQLHLSRCNNFCLDPRFTTIERFNHSGNIYCLSVDHGNFYMEHKGCAHWTGNSDAKIHLDRVSHIISGLWMDNKNVLGELEVLNDDRCPCGNMLACLLDRKARVGISSRGVGDMEQTTIDEEEAYVVLEGYSILSFDAVCEPSVSGAQLKKLEESINRNKKIIPEGNMKEVKEALLFQEFLKQLRA